MKIKKQSVFNICEAPLTDNPIGRKPQNVPANEILANLHYWLPRMRL